MKDLALIKRETDGINVLMGGKLKESISQDTLTQNNVLVFNKKEALNYIADKIAGISVKTVLEQYEEKMKSLIYSKEEIFLIEAMDQKIFAADINSQDFPHFVQSLIYFQNSVYNFLTLIDREESKAQGNEFVYAQIKISNGYIYDVKLIEEVIDMQLTNEQTTEHYTQEDIEEIGVYMVLLDHFTLRKDKNKITIGEY